MSTDSSTDALGYPATFAFDPPATIARWRPLVHWLLVIPHLVVLYALGIVAEVLVIVAWFVGVFTGKIPEGIQTPIAMYIRYSARVSSYALFLREEYPPFAFDASFAEPGNDPRVRVDFSPELEGRNRLTIFFRLFMVIPQAIVLAFVAIGASFVMIVAWFAVIILGRWPEGMRDFVVGFIRWSTRLNAYASLLTDEYPPFTLH
ncbi:MAG: DUF4389 domain-containing protein [Aeromicrobium sp.]